MKPLTLLIVISLAINASLAGWWWQKRSRIPSVLTTASPVTPSASGETVSVTNSPPAQPVIQVVQTGSWKDIQSADLKEYIRRLRAAGCPEATIQDIILAAVNRLYAGRIGKLWPDRGKVEPYWKTEKRDLAKRKQNRENRRKERELRKEKSALLVELLGVDPEKSQGDREDPYDYQSWQDSRLAFLPESKREAVSDYLADCDDKEQEFSEQNWGFRDAESRAGRKQLQEERMKGLAQFLTPEEVREFELRNSPMAEDLAYGLQNMDSLGREQYEDIFDITKKYGDSIYSFYPDDETKEGRQRAQETRTNMQAEIATALGPDMALEYKRAQDYEYQRLKAMAKHYNLPAETVNKVHSLKETVQQSVKDLQTDTTLTPEQRQKAMQQIALETQNTVKNTLGDQYYKSYLRNGGWWITRLSAPPPAPR